MAWWPDSPRHQLGRAGDAGAGRDLVGTEPWVSAGAGRQSPQGGRGGHVSGPLLHTPLQTHKTPLLPATLFYFHPSTYCP